MTEQEYRELFRKDCDEKMKPLVEQVTNLVMKAYEYGLNLGLSTANQIIESKQSDWKDQHPRKGLWDAKKVCKTLHEIINSDTIVQYLIFDDENIDFDSELFFDDLRKAMED